jgi:hypothetical protein
MIKPLKCEHQDDHSTKMRPPRWSMHKDDQATKMWTPRW